MKGLKERAHKLLGPLIGIIMGILILRPLHGGGFTNHGSTLTCMAKAVTGVKFDVAARGQSCLS